MTADLTRAVLDFWFADTNGEAPREVWWKENSDFDRQISEQFGAAYDQAAVSELDALSGTPEGILALIIILDQFPRNLFRDDARAFATDDKALGFSEAAIRDGMDQGMAPFHRQFLYMPFQHSEDLEVQERSVALFATINPDVEQFATAHRDIIARFGRFPHRNDVLGRETTAEERDFLAEHGRGF